MTMFPKPWRLVETGPGSEYVALDANDRKLFYIKSDEGECDGPEEDRIDTSVLEYGTDEENAELLYELMKMFGADEP